VKWFNKVFTNITVSHAYVSNYNMGSFNTNLARQQRELDGEPLINDNGDFMPANQITMVTITEQFAPFIGFNVRMKNSLTARVDYKKDRNLSLSLANNQMTEMRGNEVQVGIGYIFKDLKLNFVSLGPTGKRPQSNLELRFDVSVRDNQTVIRRIVEQLDQVTAGNTITTIKFTADYAISAKVTAQVFYDQIISTYRTSNAFPTSNTNVGVNIRINLAQ
jgi:cell surface protein SprA